MAHSLLQGAEPEASEQFAYLFGDEHEEVLDELRLAGETLTQQRILGGDADGAGVEMADAHHDATRDDERRRREAEFLGSEQCTDDHVASGLELAVDLHRDAVAKSVEQQGLLRLGETDLPGGTRMLQGCQRRCTGTAVVAGDQHDVGVCLRHTRGDRSDAELTDELDVYARLRIGILQIVDQLGEILDRVDVVMRWRRDEADARRRTTNLGDPRIHLVRRKLAALTGFRALRHLDLDVGAVAQVVRGDTEASRRDLLDRTATPVTVLVVMETTRILAALTGIRPSAESVHGDGQGLVRLGRDRTEAHRAGRETLDDLTRGFDLVDRDRITIAEVEVEQSTKSCHSGRLIVDHLGVFLEHLVLTGARGVLKLEHGVRVEQVVFTLAPPLVLAADRELAVCALGRTVVECQSMSRCDVGGDLVESDTSELAVHSTEELVDGVLVETDHLEELGAGVRGDRGDAHLAHHLEHALARGLDVVVAGGLEFDVAEHSALDHVLDRFEGHVRIDRCRTESHQRGDVVDLAAITRFDDQADTGALALADQVVVNRGCQQQRRNRCERLVGFPVAEHDEAHAVVDGSTDLGADLVERLAQPGTTLGHRVEPVDLDAAEVGKRVVLVDPDQLGEGVVVDHR
ncbi:Uncharacterised protein [Mycobacteroides abscessus subsp. abscessus]|nr:Uncharacterised protein [Mycobacteroides abscessus subsp. abscessus]